MAEFDFQTLKKTLGASADRWKAAETPLTKLSLDEKRRRLGASPSPGATTLEAREQAAAKRAAAPEVPSATPAAWDWRMVDGKDFLGKLRDQESCGSCVAFGTIAAIEGTKRAQSKDHTFGIDLSEAHLFYCHAAVEGRNCENGWWPDRALDMTKKKGIVDEACFPYTAGNQDCRLCEDAAKRTTKIKSWSSLSTPAGMKDWVASKGPLVACFTVYEDFYYYDGGIYDHRTGNVLGGHCVTCVGYSDADQCWIMRNSWGPDWGEEGYFRIGYGEAGIDYEMWGVEIDGTLPETDTVRVENALITGLWANVSSTTPQAFVQGIGWCRLSSPDFVVLASAARFGERRCTLTIKGDTIIELYVL